MKSGGFIARRKPSDAADVSLMTTGIMLNYLRVFGKAVFYKKIKFKIFALKNRAARNRNGFQYIMTRKSFNSVCRKAQKICFISEYVLIFIISINICMK